MRILRQRPNPADQLQSLEAVRRRMSRQWSQSHPAKFGVEAGTNNVLKGWVLTWIDGGDQDEDGTTIYGPHPHYAIDLEGSLWRRIALPPPGTLFELYGQIDLLKALESSRYLRKFFGL